MKVYVKTDERDRIIAINSAMFLNSFIDWTEIDDGEGDRFTHAQSHYFPLPLMDDNGVYHYKLVNGVPVERTVEEIIIDTPQIEEELEDRIKELEEILNE